MDDIIPSLLNGLDGSERQAAQVHSTLQSHHGQLRYLLQAVRMVTRTNPPQCSGQCNSVQGLKSM